MAPAFWRGMGLGFEVRASCLQSRRSTALVILEMGSQELFPSNLSLPNLSLLNSWDYRHEQLVPGTIVPSEGLCPRH
jgi:hypothetical protein